MVILLKLPKTKSLAVLFFAKKADAFDSWRTAKIGHTVQDLGGSSAKLV